MRVCRPVDVVITLMRRVQLADECERGDRWVGRIAAIERVDLYPPAEVATGRHAPPCPRRARTRRSPPWVTLESRLTRRQRTLRARSGCRAVVGVIQDQWVLGRFAALVRGVVKVSGQSPWWAVAVVLRWY